MKFFRTFLETLTCDMDEKYQDKSEKLNQKWFKNYKEAETEIKSLQKLTEDDCSADLQLGIESADIPEEFARNFSDPSEAVRSFENQIFPQELSIKIIKLYD